MHKQHLSILRGISLAVLIQFFPGALSAAAVSADNLWRNLDQLPAAPANARVEIHAKAFKKFTLDAQKLRGTLGNAPLEFTANTAGKPQITLPMPDGTFARFEVEESPVMEAPLAAKYPEIKSYRGRGIDDRAATVRFDMNAKTFHAQILSPSGAVYIDPYWQHDGRVYMSYFKKDLEPNGRQFKCYVEGSKPAAATQESSARVAADSGGILRTYRLACGTSIRYSQYHGGPTMVVSDILAALVTMVNRVSGVYETEWAIKMVLVADNDKVIATVTNPTPYSDTPGDIFTNPGYLDAMIGSANYDIGHCVTVGSGGISGLGVVCQGLDVTFGGSAKAASTTGIDPPVGDGFWIDYVAHEMGHEFGGNHTFNGDGTNCGDTNQNPSTAYEPGSGSTIMAYAGICGAANDLQPHSDPYFHFISLQEIAGYNFEGAGSNCPVETPTGNNSPTVTAHGPGVAGFPSVAFKIPDQTPFSLTAFNGGDPDNDAITYCWEEADIGPQKAGTAPDNGSSAIFRSFNPTPSPTRTFPRWSSLLTNNTQNIGEKLPTTNRKLDFTVTVRDNRGGWAMDSIRLNVVDTGTGFAVTSPNTAVTYNGGSTQTVTWNVAGTTGNGINTSLVNILLSTDATPTQGDPTFPIVLAANTPNDGSETVTIPLVNTSKARIMVQAVGNVFFDVSDANFTITAPPPTLSSIVSRKQHGAAGNFDVDLPLTLPSGIECRSGGTSSDYTLVFTFNSPLSTVGSAAVSTGTVKPSSGINPNNPSQYILELTGIPSGHYITATLSDLNGTRSNATARMGVLPGDVNGNGVVTNTDVASVKAQVAAPVATANFRTDVSANGVITNTDVSSTKAQVGSTLQ